MRKSRLKKITANPSVDLILEGDVKRMMEDGDIVISDNKNDVEKVKKVVNNIYNQVPNFFDLIGLEEPSDIHEQDGDYYVAFQLPQTDVGAIESSELFDAYYQKTQYDKIKSALEDANDFFEWYYTLNEEQL